MSYSGINSSSNGLESETIGEWAGRYAGVATLGTLSVLLATGKAINHQLEKHNSMKRFILPPAIVGGLIGCFLFHATESFVSEYSKNMYEEIMGVIVVNLINLCFAGLVLGFGASKSNVPHTKAIFLGIWHEALPMLIYSQMLLWGQSCVALLVSKLFFNDSGKVSQFLGVLICLGMETGRDVKSYSKSVATDIAGAKMIIRKAENVGLFISITTSISVMLWNSFGKLGQKTKMRHLKRKESDLSEDALQHKEHFNKDPCVTDSKGRNVEIEMQQENIESTVPLLSLNNAIQGGATDTRQRKKAAEQEYTAGSISSKKRQTKNNIYDAHLDSRASLGAHISIMAAAVFIAWLIDIAVRFVEEQNRWLAKNHIISGFRLFKLSMCSALTLVCILRRTTQLQFRSEWFFRLSGLCLDLMAIAALGTMSHRPLPPGTSYAFYAVVIACCAWNALAFFVLAPKMFPNHWVSRGGALTADTLGHSWVGLITVRAIDPGLRTPVPLAYAYKMMLFFVPDSGAKNAIVAGAIDDFGIIGSIAICLVVLSFWIWLFVFKVMPRMPQFQTKKRREIQRQEREREFKELGFISVDALSDADQDLLGSSIPLMTIDDAEKTVKQRPTAARSDMDIGSAINDASVDIETVSTTIDNFEPNLSEPSDILNTNQVRRLTAVLPPTDQIRNWHLVYSTDRDGASSASLLYHCSRTSHSSILIVIEDTWGYIFGGYAETTLRESRGFYEAGRCFVFSFRADGFKRWTYSGSNPYAIMTNQSSIAMGGGDGCAFKLDDELDQGTSEKCSTFDSPMLSSSEFFRVLSMECWIFK